MSFKKSASLSSPRYDFLKDLSLIIDFIGYIEQLFSKYQVAHMCKSLHIF